MRYSFTKNATVRTTAQVVIMKAIEKCNLIDQYSLIYENIRREHDPQKADANKRSLAEDFRFNQINGDNLLNSTYFLQEIPRLTEMFVDEVYFEVLDDFDEKLIIEAPLNSNQALFVERDPGIPAETNGDSSGIAQKKIVPFKQTFVDRELMNSLPAEFQAQQEKNRLQGDLVVVASLVTKIPNLGGISRTCEVFSVKEYAIDNLKDIEKSEFQALRYATKYLNPKFHIPSL